MSEYYLEVPRRKVGIKIPDLVTIDSVQKERFYFVSCDDENNSFFEYWLDSNGINYQESEKEVQRKNKQGDKRNVKRRNS